MNCKEVAIFKEDSLEVAIELNKKLISEMQMESNNTLIDWVNAKSAKETTAKWLPYPSNQNDIFYDFLEKR